VSSTLPDSSVSFIVSRFCTCNFSDADIQSINQSINQFFDGGLNNKQLPQGPRKEKKVNSEDKARIGEWKKMQF